MSDPSKNHHSSPPAEKAAPNAVVGQTLGNRYRLIGFLGSGASARVYLADDLSLGRRVAVKCLRPGLSDDPRFLKLFRAEAKAAAQLSHPNLLAIYDWSEEDSAAYIVTEVLLGGSLLDLNHRGTRLSISQGLLIALQVAQGLDYAHRLGWVHRDIKPANLLFGPDGRLRIADFGIARAVAEAGWTEPEGQLVGTARYAAPEQAEGKPVDGKADVYALALTVVEAITGKVPLVGDSALATMVLRQDRDVGSLTELGPLGVALAPAGVADPARRATATELIEALTRNARSLARPERLPVAVTSWAATSPKTSSSGPEVDTEPTETHRGDPGASLARTGAGTGSRGKQMGRPVDVRRRQAESTARRRRKSDRLRYEPIERPAAAGVGAGTESERSGDDVIALDDVVMIERPRSRPVSGDLKLSPPPPPSRVSSPQALSGPKPPAAAPKVRRSPAGSWLDNSKSFAPKSTPDPTAARAPSGATVTPPETPDRGPVSRYPGRSPLEDDGPGAGLIQRRPTAAFEQGQAKPAATDAVGETRDDPSTGRWELSARAGMLAVLAAVGLLASVLVVVFLATRGDDTTDSTNRIGATPAAAVVGVYLGGSLDDAEADAATNDWQLIVTTARRDGTRAGEVIEQDPSSGDELRAGERLDLVVSVGAELTDVPDVIGSTTDDAAAMLTNAGFVVGTTQAIESEAAEGEVLALEAGGVDLEASRGGSQLLQLESGMVVSLVVSGGSTAQPMPSFVGLTVEQSIDQANDLGVRLHHENAHSSRYEAGFVVHTEPPTGTPVRPGDDVTILVSIGPELLTVPNVTGKTVAAAADELFAAGFEVSTGGLTDTALVGSTTPAIGEEHPIGTTITLDGLLTPPTVGG